MWAPHGIFRAFQQQCEGRIERIKAYIALRTNGDLSVEELAELLYRITNLEEQRHSMETAWAKHLADVQKWGTATGQKEPGEELLQLLSEICEHVDECLEKSRYFYEMKSTARVRTLTTATLVSGELPAKEPKSNNIEVAD